MDEEAGFLAAIRQTPADDTARLVYADWLDEQGGPANQDKAEFIRLELRMAEAPEEGLNRIRWLNKLQKLAATLTPGWLAVVSHPKLEGCRVSFQLECPKQWNRLAPTDSQKVRFCESCGNHVYYCETLEEARDHSARGNCVAVSLALARRPVTVTHRFPIRPGRLIRLSPEMIVRVGRPARTGNDVPPEPALPQPPDVPEWVPAPEPSRPRRSRRKKRKKEWRNRNIQRENWEEQSSG